MSKSPAQDLATLIDASGEATLGTDLFVFNWNEEIDKQCLFLDAGSVTTDNYGLVENSSVQVLFRGGRSDSGQTVYDFARPIVDALFNVVQNDANGSGYAFVHPLNELTPLGRDDNGRHIYTSNWLTYRTEQS